MISHIFHELQEKPDKFKFNYFSTKSSNIEFSIIFQFYVFNWRNNLWLVLKLQRIFNKKNYTKTATLPRMYLKATFHSAIDQQQFSVSWNTKAHHLDVSSNLEARSFSQVPCCVVLHAQTLIPVLSNVAIQPRPSHDLSHEGLSRLSIVLSLGDRLNRLYCVEWENNKICM